MLPACGRLYWEWRMMRLFFVRDKMLKTVWKGDKCRLIPGVSRTHFLLSLPRVDLQLWLPAASTESGVMRDTTRWRCCATTDEEEAFICCRYILTVCVTRQVDLSLEIRQSATDQVDTGWFFFCLFFFLLVHFYAKQASHTATGDLGKVENMSAVQQIWGTCCVTSSAETGGVLSSDSAPNK